MSNNDNKVFEYTYSAPTENEKKEIESIRRQYAPKTQNQTKFDRLKALDKKVKSLAKLVSLNVGIAGTLIFGTGLTMVLEWKIWFWGIAVMLVGAITVLSTYTIYGKLIDHGKKKYGDEILKLSDELLKKD